MSTVIVYSVQEQDVRSTVKCTGMHAASARDSYCACAERRKPAVNTNLRTSMHTCTTNKDLPVVCDCHKWPGPLQTTPLRKLYDGLAVTKHFLGNDPSLTQLSHAKIENGLISIKTRFHFLNYTYRRNISFMCAELDTWKI